MSQTGTVPSVVVAVFVGGHRRKTRLQCPFLRRGRGQAPPQTPWGGHEHSRKPQKTSFHKKEIKMSSLNRVFLIGNLVRKPELKFTTGGKGIVNVGMAVNRRFKNSAGELKEEVTFVEVSIFGKQAEGVFRVPRQRQPRFVEGRLHLDQWEQQGEKSPSSRSLPNGFNSCRSEAARR